MEIDCHNLSIDKGKIVNSCISHNHYSLLMANKAEIESDEHRIIKKNKKFFEEGNKNKQSVIEKSKKVVRKYLDNLDMNTLLKIEKPLLDYTNYLIEKRNFHFDNINHFKSTAERFLNLVMFENQDAYQLVDYNIRYGFTKMVKIGDKLEKKLFQFPSEEIKKPEQLSFKKKDETEELTKFREKCNSVFGSFVYEAWLDNLQLGIAGEEKNILLIGSESSSVIEEIERKYFRDVRKRDGQLLRQGIETIALELLKEINPHASEYSINLMYKTEKVDGIKRYA